MIFYVYILKSKKLNKLYFGFTPNLLVRINKHNSGKSLFTSKAKDWQLLYAEMFINKQDAVNREQTLKQFGGSYRSLKKRLENTFIDFQGGIKDSQ